MTAPQLPLLDYSIYVEGSPTEKRKFANSLVESFQKYRCAKIVNYGIENDQLQQTFEQSKRFFRLNNEAKSFAAHPNRPNPHRGYSYIGQENVAGLSRPSVGSDVAKVVDIKESFDIGAKDDEEYPNIWPHEDDIPGYRTFLETFFGSCYHIHLNILKALSTGLQIPVGRFAQLHSQKESELRLLHYPQALAEDLKSSSKTRIAEHTDAGSMTLLFQDDIGGLELEIDNEFHPVDAPLPTMLVILGDSMQHWTNDKLKSVWHRVVAPPLLQDEVEIVPERYSIAYFGKPDRVASLRPFPEFADTNHVENEKYIGMTAGQYNQAKLERTYKAEESSKNLSAIKAN